MQSEHAGNLYEAKTISQEVQQLREEAEETKQEIRFATYLAELHYLEKQVVFWRTIAITLMSFTGFMVIFTILGVIFSSYE